MTGYGQARWESDGCVVSVELRSVNGRYYKLASRLPHEFAPHEREFDKRIRARVARGSVDLVVRLELTGARAARPLNRAALASYVRQLVELGSELHVPVSLTPDAIASLPGALEAEALSDADAEQMLRGVMTALDAALDELERMRLAEGKNLRAALLAHCAAIERLVAEAEAQQPADLAEHQRRLVERVGRLLEGSGIALSERDVAREAAIYADRSNIAEEIARVRSHVEQMREALDADGPVGRRLEFIGQELQREVNTMSAKAAAPALSRCVAALHGEVDKIREQVANVE